MKRLPAMSPCGTYLDDCMCRGAVPRSPGEMDARHAASVERAKRSGWTHEHGWSDVPARPVLDETPAPAPAPAPASGAPVFLPPGVTMLDVLTLAAERHLRRAS